MKQPRREKRRRTKAAKPSNAGLVSAFPALEQKLVWLILDAAASKGEIVNGAVKLVESWRRRGLTAEELLRPTRNTNGAERVSQPDRRDDFARYRDVVIPFGKFRTMRVIQVWQTAPDYLAWAADAWELQAPKVAGAIRKFLKAAEYREARSGK